MKRASNCRRNFWQKGRLLPDCSILNRSICVKAVAFGFKGERLAAAIPLTRYLAISGLFTVLTGFLTGLLQSEKQFLAPALAMLAGNAVLLLSLFFLTGRLGINSWTVGQNALAIDLFEVLIPPAKRSSSVYGSARRNSPYNSIRGESFDEYSDRQIEEGMSVKTSPLS